MKLISYLTLLLGLTFTGLQAAPIKVLLISGQNNHDWKKTTPLIKQFLEKSGDVEVTITERPDQLTAKSFQNIDVIVSNWNAVRKQAKIKTWPEPTKKAYVDFVRNGGGHLCIHAGSSSFYDWPEYHAISLMTWIHKKTTHGAQHVFPIRVDQIKHPVTQGWQPKPIKDELWRNVKVDPNATILASSFSASTDGGSESWEPCVFVGQFGNGRCFTTSLGHDVHSLSQPPIQKIIIRGLQWVKPRP
jgi:type 1 glutamine amidotransferase